ncbi:MAG: hypothetical protein NTV00_10375 [Methylococcales bacterium]|nr:hypothetical protein [Methylococcales bacterium]
MFKQRNKLKVTLVTGLFVLSMSVKSAAMQESWEDRLPWQETKASIVAAAQSAYASDQTINPAYASLTANLMQFYILEAWQSDLYFSAANKTNFPVALKDRAGNYYLELASPSNAVVVPTNVGNFYINLEAVRINKELADIDLISYKEHPDLDSNINRSTALSRLRIQGISSANYWPQIEAVGHPLGFLNVGSSSVDHGGAWVGVQSLEFGSEAAAVTTTVCGVPTSSEALNIKIFDNGVFSGYWRASYAFAHCESGQVKTTAVSEIPPFNSISDLVDFK